MAVDAGASGRPGSALPVGARCACRAPGGSWPIQVKVRALGALVLSWCLGDGGREEGAALPAALELAVQREYAGCLS